MVLYAVDEFLRMLHAHAHGPRLGFEGHAGRVEEAIDVAGRMTGGQHHGAAVHTRAVGQRHAAHRTVGQQQAGDARPEADLAATVQYGLPHGPDDGRQLVGADVRMGVDSDLLRCAMVTEDVKHLAEVAALGAAREELAVRKGARPTLAESVVGIGIEALVAAEGGQVALAGAHVLAALEHHRAQSQLYQAQGRKQTARAGSHHHHAPAAVNGPVAQRRRLHGRLLAHPDAILQLHEYLALAGIDRPAQQAHHIHIGHIHTGGCRSGTPAALLVVSLFGRQAQKNLLVHLCFVLTQN